MHGISGLNACQLLDATVHRALHIILASIRPIATNASEDGMYIVLVPFTEHFQGARGSFGGHRRIQFTILPTIRSDLLLSAHFLKAQ